MGTLLDVGTKTLLHRIKRGPQCFKKNLNTSKPSEHPLSGEKLSKYLDDVSRIGSAV